MKNRQPVQIRKLEIKQDDTFTGIQSFDEMQEQIDKYKQNLQNSQNKDEQ